MRSPLLRHTRPALILALAAGLLLGACGDDDSDDAAGGNAGSAVTTTTAGEATTTTAGAATTVTAATGDGCAATGSGTPAGAATAPAIDVDGDGRADTAWLAGATGGERRFGVTTASGATFSTPFNSASPIAASALVFEPDGQAPAYALVSDGRIGSLWLVADCRISKVVNVQGDPYTFDLGGFTGYGTGVGCIDADGDGKRDLVGLLAESTDASTTHITRTIIELDGDHAANGAKDEITAHSPADDVATESARSVTCGDLTLDGDGVHEPE
jgi:hypothetical protein